MVPACLRSIFGRHPLPYEAIDVEDPHLAGVGPSPRSSSVPTEDLLNTDRHFYLYGEGVAMGEGHATALSKVGPVPVQMWAGVSLVPVQM